ncbi:hypothetical protein ACFS07_36085 [Undibacterium arcticum]
MIASLYFNKFIHKEKPKMKQIHEMTFPEFSNAIQASGGMNRWPQLGAANEVVSYSVFMNGEIADALPEIARTHEFRDVTIHALTEKNRLESRVVPGQREGGRTGVSATCVHVQRT